MKVVLAAFVVLAGTGCVRAAEGVVREQAASAFACAHYALHVEEIGPDVYRASGCGQELIYACQERLPRRAGPDGAASGAKPDEEHDDDAFGNDASSRPIVCARRP